MPPKAVPGVRTNQDTNNASLETSDGSEGLNDQHIIYIIIGAVAFFIIIIVYACIRHDNAGSNGNGKAGNGAKKMKDIKDMTYLEMKQLQNIQMDQLADAHVSKGGPQPARNKMIKGRKNLKNERKSRDEDLESQNQAASNGMQRLGA